MYFLFCRKWICNVIIVKCCTCCFQSVLFLRCSILLWRFRVLIVPLLNFLPAVLQTDIPDFRQTEMEVYRRFSDFLGLHEKLVVKHLHQGRIIPPAPEKSVIGEAFYRVMSFWGLFFKRQIWRLLRLVIPVLNIRVFLLSDHGTIILSVLSVTLVYCGQMVARLSNCWPPLVVRAWQLC